MARFFLFLIYDFGFLICNMCSHGEQVFIYLGPVVKPRDDILCCHCEPAGRGNPVNKMRLCFFCLYCNITFVWRVVTLGFTTHRLGPQGHKKLQHWLEYLEYIE